MQPGIPTNAVYNTSLTIDGIATPITLELTSDDSLPEATYAFSSPTINEFPYEDVTLIATLSAVSGVDVTIPFTLSDNASTAVEVLSTEIVVLAGELTGSITVSTTEDLDDDLVEILEPIVFTFGTISNATSDVTDITLNLESDDNPTITAIGTTGDVTSQVENGGSFEVTASINLPSSKDISIPFTFGGDAVFNEDYSVDFEGKELLNIEDIEYRYHFKEAVEPWSYLKFPYMTKYGREKGWNRVGPLARLNTASHITTPFAEIERQLFKAYTNNKPNNMTMHTHWARLIEMLHCAELMKELLHDDEIMGTDFVRKGTPRNKGIGIIEAPRGTLIHEYHTDDKGLITKCNLIVSTTHNNEAMNRGVRVVAQEVLNDQPEITEPMLNQIEMAIRAYDPCLSCATHALGEMPLIVQIEDLQGNLIDEKIR